MRPRLSRLAPLRVPLGMLVAGLVFLSLPWWPPFDASYRVTQLQLAAALTIIVLGLNLLTGYSGQISIGHSGFVLVGAYVLALLLDRGLLGLPVHPVLAVLAATAVAAALGLAVGVPALRLSGPYLAIVTVGFALVVPAVLKWDALSELTGGIQGVLVSSPRPPDTLPSEVTPGRWRYFVIAMPAVAAGALAWNLAHSRFGRVLIAIREDELAAEQVGIDVARHKALAFGMSAGYAGLGGALFSYASLGFVAPDAYGLLDSISYLTAIVVGGLGSIPGSVLGALFVAYEPEVVDWVLGDSWTVALGSHRLLAVPSPFRAIEEPAALSPAVYGLLLIVTILVAPRGLAGVASALGRRVGRMAARAGERVRSRL
nr:hypothetical protein A2Y61_08340 [uncultured bacterium]